MTTEARHALASLDLEQRIERVARLLVAYRFGWDEAGDATRVEAERDYWRVRAREVLAAAFPELLSTPPTKDRDDASGWLREVVTSARNDVQRWPEWKRPTPTEEGK